MFLCWFDQIVLMTLTLLPLRAFLSFSCLLLCWFFALVSLIGWSQADAQRPFPRWRKWVSTFLLYVST